MEGHGFSRATSNHPYLTILSGARQPHRGASTKDQVQRVSHLPTSAFMGTDQRVGTAGPSL